MKRAILVLGGLVLGGLALAGCSFTAGQDKPAASVPAPIVDVSGPRFAPTAFQCGGEPFAPDPAGDQKRQGSAAAADRAELVAWGRACQVKLKSAGRTFDAAGQIVRGPR